jgi:hypothetical protein
MISLIGAGEETGDGGFVLNEGRSATALFCPRKTVSSSAPSRNYAKKEKNENKMKITIYTIVRT